MAARGRKYDTPSEALPNVRKGLELAIKRPGVIFIRESEGGSWQELSGDPAEVLLTERQRLQKNMRNAQISSEPMTQRSLTCDDDTWAKFLKLGGSKWFRKTVNAAHARAEKANK